MGAGANKIGELSVKLAEAALIAREKGDEVQALFFAIKAAETLHLAKLLGWNPPSLEPATPSPVTGDERTNNTARGGESHD